MFYCIFFWSQGTLKQLEAITGWEGKRVLYFGDHPYTDLADVTLEHGWRTGAIVHELSVRCYFISAVAAYKPNQKQTSNIQSLFWPKSKYCSLSRDLIAPPNVDLPNLQGEYLNLPPPIFLKLLVL